MEPCLIAVAGPLSGASLPLTRAEISVGRDDTNDVALADQSVSPRHCLFACREGRVTIRDLDRGNPSFVDGLPASDQALQDGNQIQIGGSLFVLRLARYCQVEENSVDRAPRYWPWVRPRTRHNGHEFRVSARNLTMPFEA
jgi:pSer/pThr/pTyr-binding forkhead associated (FHA) protein